MIGKYLGLLLTRQGEEKSNAGTRNFDSILLFNTCLHCRCIDFRLRQVTMAYNQLHYIITRFNLRATPDSAGKQLDEDWLRYRFDLFDKFCFPTVKNQTEQDFKWLVLFDIDTQKTIKDRLERIHRDWQNFVPVFFPPGTDATARKAVMSHMTSLPDMLITTRLDNDDALHRNFIERIRECSQVDGTTVLEFPVGYVCHKNRIYLDRQKSNPFTSLVERVDTSKDQPFTTIYSGSHLAIDKLGRVLVVTEEPSWIQVVHGDNVANKPRGIRCKATALAEHFDIDHSQIKSNEDPVEFYWDKGMSMIRKTINNAKRSVKQGLNYIRH